MPTKEHAASTRGSARPHASDVNGGTTVVRGEDGRIRVSLKISDPAARRDLAALKKEVTRTPKQAAAFLRDVGITTASGKLSKRFGG